MSSSTPGYSSELSPSSPLPSSCICGHTEFSTAFLILGVGDNLALSETKVHNKCSMNELMENFIFVIKIIPITVLL
jgi:hypothetical protein